MKLLSHRWFGALALGSVIAAVPATATALPPNECPERGIDVVSLQRGGREILTARRCGVSPWNATESVSTPGQPLLNGDFDDGLADWIVTESGGSGAPGSVTPVDGQAELLEGDSFLVTLEQQFRLQSGTPNLRFDLSLVPGFDLTDAFVPDAFEATLLDVATGVSVVPAWDPLATSFFNMQEDGTVLLGAATTWDGTTASVDLSGVAAGTEIVLYFDLIGGDSDAGGGVRIDNAFDCSDIDGDSVNTCADNCPYDANLDQSDVDTMPATCAPTSTMTTSARPGAPSVPTRSRTATIWTPTPSRAAARRSAMVPITTATGSPTKGTRRVAPRARPAIRECAPPGRSSVTSALWSASRTRGPAARSAATDSTMTATA
jgi:hypothetical protein